MDFYGYAKLKDWAREELESGNRAKATRIERVADKTALKGESFKTWHENYEHMKNTKPPIGGTSIMKSPVRGVER